MRFAKYQAHGNDYIVLDPADGALPSPDAIRRICDRHYGVGSDGILFGPVVRNGVFGLRIFNPDGGEAEKSGNGIRIFARYLMDRGYVTGETGRIATSGGEVAFRYLDASASRIEVAMGKVSFWSEDIPVAGDGRDVVGEVLQLPGKSLVVTCLTIGNPHCVIVTDRATPEDAQTFGPLIERHLIFPNRTNVQFAQVIDRQTVRIEIWERGAGYTRASGSSSCAAASAAKRLGLVDSRVRVLMPGGEMDVAIADDWSVSLTGNVAPTFSGELAPALLAGRD